MYYFTLDEGILAMQSTDPAAVDKERRRAFRLNGLAVDDPEALAAQSPNFPEVLNVRVNRDGGLYKGTLATDQNGFRALTDRALARAGALLEGIRGGNAAIAPSEHRLRTPCAWCDLRSACLFDPRLDAGCVRRFGSLRGDEVMERVKLEDSSDG